MVIHGQSIHDQKTLPPPGLKKHLISKSNFYELQVSINCHGHMLGVSAAHRGAVSMMFTPHGAIHLALSVVILEETTGKLPTHEMKKRKRNPKESGMHF